jgi:hypothetical protein
VGVQPSTTAQSPPLVQWTPEREARGASPASEVARCLVRGCIVRFADRPDRLCPHHRPEAEFTADELALIRAHLGRRRDAAIIPATASATGSAPAPRVFRRLPRPQVPDA